MAATARSENDWPAVRVHVVSGKGGTGKSTVAASLALALARPGRKVLLCEVEGRQGIARMFDTEPLPYAERRIATGLADGEDGSGGAGGAGGGDVYALHIDAEAALLEYLAMYYRLGPAGKALDRFGVIEFATTIAPGVRDVLLTGKVYEAAKPERRGSTHRSGAPRHYDAVVLDAPPTGRIAQFLGVNDDLAGLAKVGPIRNQADNVMRLLRSRQTAVHLTTLLEEMPVQETADGIAELRGAGLPVGGVVVNQVRPADLGPRELELIRSGRLRAEDVARDLAGAGVEHPGAVALDLIAEATEHAARRQLEDEQLAVVAGLGLPTYELPRLPGGVDLGGLYELAALLREQGMA